MEVTFWGVRGSYPVPGPATVRYGGNTSCIEVRSARGDCLVVDAGTGMRALGKKLAAEQVGHSTWQHHIILSHVHWDHIQGLPFFEPAYIGGTFINVYAPRAAAEELQQVIGGITRHEFFPVPLAAVPADFDFKEVTPGAGFTIGDFEIVPMALNHPFGAVGYRIEADGTAMAYVSDTAPFDRMLHKQHFTAAPETPTAEDRKVLEDMHRTLVESLKDVDTVIYDTHFTAAEYERFPHWGHSTPDHALEVCREADCRRLVLYHHAPAHDDDQMDEIEYSYRKIGRSKGVEVIVARERMALVIGATTDPGVF